VLGERHALPDTNSRLVYSSDGGRVPQEPEPRARKNASPRARKPTAAPPDDGVVRVQRTAKGHGGKTVTAITGLPGGERELDALLKVLKQHCGAGGSREGTVLEIQGDHRERLRAKLEQLGHRVKLAGG
jgi:translation initiation factor 1